METETREVLQTTHRFYLAAASLTRRIATREGGIDDLINLLARALYNQDREAEIRTWLLAYAMLPDPNAGEVIKAQIARLGGKL